MGHFRWAIPATVIPVAAIFLYVFLNGGAAIPVEYQPLAAFGAFMAAGLYYSGLGYIKKVRRALAGEKVPIDYDKMGRTLSLGIMLGIAAFVYTVADQNEATKLVVDNHTSFLTVVGLATTAIMTVDRIVFQRPSLKVEDEPGDEIAEHEDEELPPPATEDGEKEETV